MPLPRRALLGSALLLPLAAACARTAAPAAPGPTVDSVHGPVAVPARARRVVSLDLSKIQRMLDVGVEPVGTVEGWQPLADHADWYASVPKVGTQAAPDVEAVAALGPDLILGSPQGVDDALYGRLSALAPTVIVQARGLGSGFQELSAADAHAAGRDAELAAVRGRYAARVAEMRATHAEGLAEGSVALLYALPTGAYSLLPESGPGEVLTDLGARFADPGSGVFAQLSTEELGRFATADLILIDAQASGAPTAAGEALRAAPTFAALTATVAPLSHLLVFSYGEALALLDQLDDVLAGRS